MLPQASHYASFYSSLKITPYGNVLNLRICLNQVQADCLLVRCCSEEEANDDKQAFMCVILVSLPRSSG